ncbi:hypothetical protein [Methylobacterium sp. Leaf88]|uniref:hypothetical protein n=1 Tax=Methylobacterium sp. Leaf88 TaxID=1736244 RepID=UPI000ADF3056|nr:hypothetical protein [Methylobacterium sp. Leaf88]
MRRRGEDASTQAWALGKAASQIRQARRALAAARDRSEDARARAAIEGMMSEIERVARRADAMRLRMNAKASGPAVEA